MITEQFVGKQRKTDIYNRFTKAAQQGLSIDVKPNKLGDLNLYEMGDRSELGQHLNGARRIFKHRLSENPNFQIPEDPYLYIEDNKVILKPIADLKEYDVSTLMHIGWPQARFDSLSINYDEVDQIGQTGIFGNIGKHYPLYIQPGLNITPGELLADAMDDLDEEDTNPVCIIEINIPKLLELREIYHDPEMFIIDDIEGEEPGAAFMILGGLPVQCIRRVYPYHEINRSKEG